MTTTSFKTLLILISTCVTVHSLPSSRHDQPAKLNYIPDSTSYIQNLFDDVNNRRHDSKFGLKKLKSGALFGIRDLEREIQLFGRFVQMTDIHVDLHYLPYSTPSSSCHRLPVRNPGAKSTKQNITVQKSEEILAGPFGTVLTACDSPSSLVDVTFDFVGKLAGISNDGNGDDDDEDDSGDEEENVMLKKVSTKDQIDAGLDFIAWTGDNARHDSDSKIPRTRSEMLLLNEVLSQELVSRFNLSEIPIIPTIGNNDVYPHNTLAHASSYLNDLADVWEPFVPKHQRRLFKTYGSFVHPTVPGRLAVFSINTLDFFQSNSFASDCRDEDSQGYLTLMYFGKILKLARKNGVKVLVLGHVPPSESAWYPSCKLGYVRLATKYGNVVGSFFGHMNVDHFLLLDSTLKEIPLRSASNFNQQIKSAASSYEFVPSSTDTQSFESSRKASTVSDHPFGANFTAAGLKTLGLRTAYLQSLFQSFADIISNLEDGLYRPKDLTIALVNPSVVPNYYPTVRLFEYDADVTQSQSAEDESKRQHQYRRKTPTTPSLDDFGTLLSYTQYYLNLTNFAPPSSPNLYSDLDPEALEWEIEYSTVRDIGISVLNVEGYLEYARKILNDESFRAKFLKWFYVSTGMEEGLRS